MAVMPSRHSPAGACALLVAAVMLPTVAAAGCTVYGPGFDGVLRLDSGRGFSAPCSGPMRAYAAVPPNDTAVAPPARSAKPAPKPAEPPPAANAAPTPAPAPAPSPVPRAAAPASDDMALLKQQTQRLRDEVARLNDETAGLRSETRRLREVLARRDVGDTEKLGSKLAPATSGTVAPKGDLLASPAAKDEARAATGTPHPADQAELERRKSVAARAWNELLDFVARMKGLGGKAE